MENEGRSIAEVVEGDRLLIYGSVRQRALVDGNTEMLKVLFQRVFPESKLEHPEQPLDVRQMIQLYIKLYGKEQEPPDGKTPNLSQGTEEKE
jgi:hypothetical protein